MNCLIAVATEVAMVEKIRGYVIAVDATDAAVVESDLNIPQNTSATDIELAMIVRLTARIITAVLDATTLIKCPNIHVDDAIDPAVMENNPNNCQYANTIELDVADATLADI